MMIAIYAFFVFKQDLISTYYLDLLSISGLFLMDLIYYIAKGVSFYRNGTSVDTDSQKIVP